MRTAIGLSMIFCFVLVLPAAAQRETGITVEARGRQIFHNGRPAATIIGDEPISVSSVNGSLSIKTKRAVFTTMPDGRIGGKLTHSATTGEIAPPAADLVGIVLPWGQAIFLASWQNFPRRAILVTEFPVPNYARDTIITYDPGTGSTMFSFTPDIKGEYRVMLEEENPLGWWDPVITLVFTR